MDWKRLRQQCEGGVVVSGESNFESAARCGLWNQRVPDRMPRAVVQVANDGDVAEAIRFARSNRLKVAVRGGGHNWCQPSLREGGLLLDLARLNRIVSLDAGKRRAMVQPVVSNRELMHALQLHGLAFPYGHCPDVRLSGYLLGGGIAWNMGQWGPGAQSVEAVEIVTASGERIVANHDQHPDYYWSALGAGYGFFGVVTGYHLRLHPLPRAIHSSTAFFPLEKAVDIAAWLGELAPRLSPALEVTLLLITAPSNLRDKAAGSGGKVSLLAVTAFADTPEAAHAAHKPLEACPAESACLSRSPITPDSFEGLFAASQATWPSGMRCRVDAAFSDADPAQLVKAVTGLMANAPSPVTLFLFAFPTGPAPRQRNPIPAYSMTGRCYGGPWTMWPAATDDAVNLAWHEQCVARLRPYVHSYYIGESDTVTYPPAAAGSFTPTSWKRLADFRQKYDPDGVFFGYADGLLPQ